MCFILVWFCIFFILFLRKVYNFFNYNLFGMFDWFGFYWYILWWKVLLLMWKGKSFINCGRWNFLMYFSFLFFRSLCSLWCSNLFFDFGINFENDVSKIGLDVLKFIRFLVFNKYNGSLFILLMKFLFCI